MTRPVTAHIVSEYRLKTDGKDYAFRLWVGNDARIGVIRYQRLDQTLGSPAHDRSSRFTRRQ